MDALTQDWEGPGRRLPVPASAERVDEKAQIQVLDRTRPLLLMCQGRVEQRTHDYPRQGTTALFAVLNVKMGQVIGQIHQRQRSREFHAFLDTSEAMVPAEWDVHLILDNYWDA